MSSEYARNPHEVGPIEGDAAAEFLRLACLVYGGDDRARWERAATMRVPAHSIHTAAAAGDSAAVRDLLTADPSSASATGGPFDWEPLLYLAYSRVPGGEPLAVARLLLEAGADPNAGYLWDGTYLFTALTGAFGCGEDAPNQPPHAHAIPLARLLLEAGADPNDDQTIYNRHFRPGTDYLELLLEFGIGGERPGPWPERLDLTPPRELLEDALVFVADNDAYADRVALLLGHGVDPDGRGTGHPALHGRRPVERAREHGAVRNEALLRAAGADVPPMDAVDELFASCMRGVAVETALGPAVIERRPRGLIDAAERGNTAAVEALAAIGYHVNFRSGETALHLAAYGGHRETCEALLRLGADRSVKDRRFDGTSVDWALHAHHDELAAWLKTR